MYKILSNNITKSNSDSGIMAANHLKSSIPETPSYYILYNGKYIPLFFKNDDIPHFTNVLKAAANEYCENKFTDLDVNTKVREFIKAHRNEDNIITLDQYNKLQEPRFVSYNNDFIQLMTRNGSIIRTKTLEGAVFRFCKDEGQQNLSEKDKYEYFFNKNKITNRMI